MQYDVIKNFANHMEYDVIKNFQKEGLFTEQNILEWKIRSLGLGLVRKWDVAKEGELSQKLMFSNMC